LHLLPHDQDDSLKTCRDSVGGREIHEGFTVPTHRGELFQAAEAATVTCCEHD
jgi:hypothetical protein